MFQNTSREYVQVAHEWLHLRPPLSASFKANTRCFSLLTQTHDSGRTTEKQGKGSFAFGNSADYLHRISNPPPSFGMLMRLLLRALANGADGIRKTRIQ
eukprot:696361-Pleurochrysis_carterae.AAC.1